MQNNLKLNENLPLCQEKEVIVNILFNRKKNSHKNTFRYNLFTLRKASPSTKLNNKNIVHIEYYSYLT